MNGELFDFMNDLPDDAEEIIYYSGHKLENYYYSR